MNDDQQPTGTPPPASPTPSEAPSPASDGGKQYAAYDTTFQRFVGGTHSTKVKAREAARAKGSAKVEIREV